MRLARPCTARQSPRVTSTKCCFDIIEVLRGSEGRPPRSRKAEPPCGAHSHAPESAASKADRPEGAGVKPVLHGLTKQPAALATKRPPTQWGVQAQGALRPQSTASKVDRPCLVARVKRVHARAYEAARREPPRPPGQGGASRSGRPARCPARAPHAPACARSSERRGAGCARHPTRPPGGRHAVSSAVQRQIGGGRGPPPPNLRPPRRRCEASFAAQQQIGGGGAIPPSQPASSTQATRSVVCRATANWVGGIAHPHGLTKQAAALATKRPPRSGGAGGRRPPRPKDACARSARCAHPSTSLREAKPPKIQKCQKSQKKQKGPKDPQVFRRKTARSALLRSKS